jgi:hypothetical protein
MVTTTKYSVFLPPKKTSPILLPPQSGFFDGSQTEKLTRRIL